MGNRMFAKRENVILIQKKDKDSVRPTPNNPWWGTWVGGEKHVRALATRWHHPTLARAFRPLHVLFYSSLLSLKTFQPTNFPFCFLLAPTQSFSSTWHSLPRRTPSSQRFLLPIMYLDTMVHVFNQNV